MVSLSEGSEKLGLRPNAALMMRYKRTGFERVYDLLRERTGIRLAVTERLLASLARVNAGDASRARLTTFIRVLPQTQVPRAGERKARWQ